MNEQDVLRVQLPEQHPDVQPHAQPQAQAPHVSSSMAMRSSVGRSFEWPARFGSTVPPALMRELRVRCAEEVDHALARSSLPPRSSSAAMFCQVPTVEHAQVKATTVS